MAELQIKPIEGFVALQLLDEPENDADDTSSTTVPSSDDSYNEAIYAIVIGVGPKAPAGIKPGATVLVRKWARDGLRVSDDTVIVETYCVIATIGAA